MTTLALEQELEDNTFHMFKNVYLFIDQLPKNLSFDFTNRALKFYFDNNALYKLDNLDYLLLGKSKLGESKMYSDPKIFLEKISDFSPSAITFSMNNDIQKFHKHLHMWYIRQNIKQSQKISADFFTPELLAPLSPQDISAIIESLCSNHSPTIITMERWKPLCEAYLMHCELPDELTIEQFTDLFDPFYQGKQTCVPGTSGRIQELYESYELDFENQMFRRI